MDASARRLRSSSPARAGTSPASTRTRTRSRGSAPGRAASSSGTGWTRTSSSEAGVADADAAVVATDGDNSNIVIGQILQRRYGIECVVVRVLDPARAEFYAKLGLRTVCPTQTAISTLTEAVRACETGAVRAGDGLMYIVIAGGGKVGSNIARSLIDDAARGDARRAAPRPLRAARGGVRPRRRCSATRPRSPCSSGRGSRGPPTSCSRSPGTTRTTSIISQIAKEGYGVPEGDRARQRPEEPAALRPARDHADGLRDVGAARARRARGAGARARAAARAAAGRARGRRGAGRRRLAGGRQARRRALAARTAPASSR